MPNYDASVAEIMKPINHAGLGGRSAICDTVSVMVWYVESPRTSGARSPGRSTVLSSP